MDVFTRKGMYLATRDLEAIDAIRKRYGLSSDSDAVRLALRLIADPDTVITVEKRKAKSKTQHVRK